MKATILGFKRRKNTGELELYFSDVNLVLQFDTKYDIAFTNPEVFISCKEGMDLFEIKPYQSAVRVVVVDKAHCISEW